MAFFQTPPELGNTYAADDVLRRYLRNSLPADVFQQIEPELQAMGELSGGELFRESIANYNDLPTLSQWGAWGKRIDQIELTPIWKKAQRITAEKGVVATAYEKKTGAWSRVHQFSLVYLIEPSWH